MSKKSKEVELTASREISLGDFIKQAQSSSSFIKVKQEANVIFNNIPRPIDYNEHFDLKGKEYLRTDYDILLAETGEKDVLDAYESIFDRYKFNKVEGIYKYPYPISSYWDILPCPPTKELKKDLSYYSKAYSIKQGSNEELMSREFNQKINDLTKSDVSFGNTSSLLLNGDFFHEKLRMIAKAKRFVLASNMFLTGDYTQEPLFDLLKEKIDQGVDVYFILDKVFALKYNKAFKRLESLGVKVFYLKNGLKLKGRTIYHTKFWVFDDEDALVYGANLLDAQIKSNGFDGGYRDTGVKVQGPVVRDLIRTYVEIANIFDSKSIPILKSIKDINDKRLEQEKKDKQRGIENMPAKGMMRVVFQGESFGQENVSVLYKELIEKAKKTIHMANVRSTQSLDFENDKIVAEITTQMLRKADEGVRVDILSNNYLTATAVKSVNYKDSGFFTWLYKTFIKREDMRAVASANHEVYKEKNPTRNFKIWHYFQFVHNKILSIDNTVNVFGSFNLNKLSTDSSYEIALVCYGDIYGDEVSKFIVRDLLNSVPILRGSEK